MLGIEKLTDVVRAVIVASADIAGFLTHAFPITALAIKTARSELLNTGIFLKSARTQWLIMKPSPTKDAINKHD